MGKSKAKGKNKMHISASSAEEKISPFWNAQKNTALHWYLMALTMLAIIPQYLMRGIEKHFQFFYDYFTTYPGDLWYCLNHYMQKGFQFPREYPAGLQMVYKVLYQFPVLWKTYDRYMILMTVFLGAFAVLTTYLLFYITRRTHNRQKKVLYLWILAPSFLFYGLLNFEFMCAFTIILAYYYFIEEDYYLSATVLALGTALKVFPIFLAPLFFFQCPKQFRFGSVMAFILTWGAFNVPFMLSNWNDWIYPYQWQITNNFAQSPKDGSYWWVIYQFFNHIGEKVGIQLGNHVGKLSLLVFAGSYYYFLKKYWHLPLARKCAIVIFLFLLTDRIYSPQYNIYLLPFLVLVDYRIDLKFFYMMDIPNIMQVMFIFFLKDGHRIFDQNIPYSPYYLQSLVFIKYIAIVILFIQNLTRPLVIDTDKAYLESREEGKDAVQVAV